MANTAISRLQAVEPWSATAFYVGGLLFLLNALLEFLGRFTALLGEPGFLNGLLYLSALLLAAGGLLGIVHHIEARAPRLARLGAWLLIVAGGSLLLLVTWATGTVLLGQEFPPGVLLIVNLGAIVFGFLVLTAGSLYTGQPTQTAGRLLGAFVLAWLVVLLFATFLTEGGPPDWMPVALNGVSGLLLGGLGYTLRTDTESTDHPGAAAT